MRFFRTSDPAFTRILLIESGSRSLVEKVIPHLLDVYGSATEIDVLTCFQGLPAGASERSVTWRISEFNSPDSRRKLIGELRRRNYSTAGMICSGEPIMTKWKWLIALKLPARFFVLNENGDYFWLHRGNMPIIREFALVRLGLSGAGALRTVGRLLVFPFSVLFLLLYAFAVHAGRFIRLRVNTSKI